MRLPIAVRDDGFSWLYAITPPCTPEKLRRKCVTYLDGIAEIREIGIGVGFAISFRTEKGDLLGSEACRWPSIPADVAAMIDEDPGDYENVKRAHRVFKERYGGKLRVGDFRAYANIRYLMKLGTDPYAVLVDESHRLGMKVWARIELRNGAPSCMRDNCAHLCILDDNGKPTQKLDFKHPEVRELWLSVIEDTVKKGVDGISLDFCVFPPFVSDPVGDAECMTELLREMRRRFNTEIIARLPIDPETHGLLWRNWVSEGLLDVIIPSVVLPGAAFDIPNLPFVEGTRGTSCRVFGCMRPKITSLDPDPRPGDEEKGIWRFNRPNTREIDYARAALILDAGVDGMQIGLGSAMAPKPESLPGTGPYTDNWHDYYENVTDAELLRYADKTYPIINSDYVPFSFRTDGVSRKIYFNAADDIESARREGKRVRVFICPIMRNLEDGEELFVSLNGGAEVRVGRSELRGNSEKPVFYRHSSADASEWSLDDLVCEPEEFDNGWWLRGRKEIEVPAELLRHGENYFTVGVRGAKSLLYVGDVDIDVKYV